MSFLAVPSLSTSVKFVGTFCKARVQLQPNLNNHFFFFCFVCLLNDFFCCFTTVATEFTRQSSNPGRTRQRAGTGQVN